MRCKTGLSDGERIEILSGVSAGDQVIVEGQAGLPDGAAVTTANTARSDERPRQGRQVNGAPLALRHSRAIILVAVALVIGGAIAAVTLPSSIYPRSSSRASSSSLSRARCRRNRCRSSSPDRSSRW